MLVMATNKNMNSPHSKKLPRKSKKACSIYRYIFLLAVVAFVIVNGTNSLLQQQVGKQEEEQMIAELLKLTKEEQTKTQTKKQGQELRNGKKRLGEISDLPEKDTTKEEGGDKKTQKVMDQSQKKEEDDDGDLDDEENMGQVIVIENENDQGKKRVESNTQTKPSTSITSNKTQIGLDSILELRGPKPKLKTHPGSYNCGCPHVCTERSMNHGISQFTCLLRIERLITRYEIDEAEACRKATEKNPEKPHDVPPCPQECNPDTCQDMKEVPTVDVSQMEVPNPMHVRQEGVAIVTKVHQPTDLPVLIQQLCLFTAAYNRHVAYDIIVFTTIPWNEEQIEELQGHVWPAKLTVAVDISSPLEEQLANMTKEDVEFLEKRCHVKEGETLSWMHYCKEEDSEHLNNLAYR